MRENNKTMEIDYKGQKVRAPDFLVVGASRSGTTSFYNYLKTHEKLFLPALKEPQFFSYLGEPFSPHPPEIHKDPWTVEDYLSLFHPAGNDQILGEASTSYLYMYPRTLENLQRFYGDSLRKVRILGVLRNPVERAWSTYMLRKQGGGWKTPFMEVAKEFEETDEPYAYYNFLASGLYYDQIKAYQAIFPSTRFYLFEELSAEPERVMKEVFEFLGIQGVFVPPNVGKTYNFSGEPRNRLVRPFYRLLFERSRLKGSIKRFLPEKLRNRIKEVLGAKLIKKVTMPDDVRGYLASKFRDDMKKLPSLFSCARQRKIIQGWLED